MTREIKIIASDHNPVKVGDGVVVSWETKTSPRPEPGPKPTPKPRKSLDERIGEALTKALEPVVSRLDGLSNRLDNLVKVNNLKE